MATAIAIALTFPPTTIRLRHATAIIIACTMAADCVSYHHKELRSPSIPAVCLRRRVAYQIVRRRSEFHLHILDIVYFVDVPTSAADPPLSIKLEPLLSRFSWGKVRTCVSVGAQISRASPSQILASTVPMQTEISGYDTVVDTISGILNRLSAFPATLHVGKGLCNINN
jgi:hypothetical protein